MRVEISFPLQGVQSVRGDFLRIIGMQWENAGFLGGKNIIDGELSNRSGARRRPIVVTGIFHVEAGGVNELDIAQKAIGRSLSFVRIFEARAAASEKPGELAACRNAVNFLVKLYEALDPSQEMVYLRAVAAVEPNVAGVLSELPIEELIHARPQAF